MTSANFLSMQLAPSRPFRFGIVAAFLAAVLVYVVYSWRWPLVWDTQVLHYVCFLMDHGWAPYRQIGDMNMPGAYLMEHLGLNLFGPSDLGWRFWDFSLCAALAAAMISMTRTYDWLAGVLGAGTFILTHAAEGPWNAGQRDQVMAVLLVVATALLFEAVRRRKAFLLYAFGLLSAMAGSIKPTVALVGLLFLALACVQLRREKVPLLGYVAWALAGFATATLLVLWFLLSFHSLHAFVGLLTTVIPHYGSISQPSWSRMLVLSLQPPLVIFTACGIAACIFNRSRPANWELTVLLLGATMGLLSFLVQRKGFTYHRYTFTAFLLPWVSIQIVMALRSSAVPRTIALFATAGVVLLYVPRTLYWIVSRPDHDDFTMYLERDLKRLGPDRLQGKVQCLDIVDGCLNALFHLQIVQSTGATGDLLLFLPKAAPSVDAARAGFWSAVVEDRPPDVYVLSNWQFTEVRQSFSKVNNWPAFAAYLDSHYVLLEQYEFPKGQKPTSQPGTDPDVPAYRIYVRRGSGLLPEVAATGTAWRQPPSSLPSQCDRIQSICYPRWPRTRSSSPRPQPLPQPG